MVKKRFISSLLLCAFAILFAHSIIPHHHHHEETAVVQPGDHHYDDQDDLDNNLLSRAFSNFQHEGGSGITYHKASPTCQCVKLNIDKETILFTQHVIRQLYKPPIIHTEHFLFAVISHLYSAPSLLRGPPAV